MTLPSANALVTLLHGDDEFAMRKLIQTREQAVNPDRSMAAMDIVTLDGRTAREDELRSATYTIPFLNPHRLVVLTSPTARIESKDKAARQRFVDMLTGLPVTTRLVLVMEDHLDRGKWKERERCKWLFDWVSDAGSRAEVITCILPRAYDMTGWLVQETRKMGGEIAPKAAALLASHTGNDTRRATLELEKLLIYVDYQRKIELDDIKAVAFPDDQVTVFQLVDAISTGQGRQALEALRKLLDQEEAQMIFGMVTRQFRLLLLAREVLDRGGGLREIQQEIRDARSDFVANKIHGQARQWSMPELESVFRRLLELDQAIKTGQMAVEVALDLLVAETCAGVVA